MVAADHGSDRAEVQKRVTRGVMWTLIEDGPVRSSA